MDFLTLAKARYSSRRLTDRPVEQEKIDRILEAGLVAPTARNYQPFKIWVIQKPEDVEKVHESTTCTFGAALFFVIGASKKQGWVRDCDGRNFADVDAAIVGTHMQLEITDLGLGSTWVGHFDPAVLKKYFPEMADYDLIALFPTGYIRDDDHPAHLHRESKAKDELVTVL